jgi:chromosome segregation ATPase
MKSKVAIIVLVIVCGILALCWRRDKSEAAKQKEADALVIQTRDGEVTKLKGDLHQQKLVNDKLDSTVQTLTQETQSLSNNLTRTSADLTKTSSDLSKTAAQLKQTAQEAEETKRRAEQAAEIAKQEIAKRDAQIAELEVNRDQLTNKMAALSTSIQGLEKNIADTQQKLTAAQGDREFLLKELKRLQTEKAELERQMADLDFLRKQISQLREELNIQKRLEWIRRGIYGAGDNRKGGQLMTDGFIKPPTSTKEGTNSAPGLEVEIKRDGGVKINSTPTNAPAAPAPATVPK